MAHTSNQIWQEVISVEDDPREGTMDAIAIRALSKSYPSRDGCVHALEQTSFSVKEGEFIAVVGPSGCGKSTLLKILAGLLPPSKGEAFLRGLP